MKFSTFFASLQEAPWYRQVLNPVIDAIESGSTLLDIGTGSGKMLAILTHEKQVKCVGTDTSADMLAEAREKLKNTGTTLHLTPAGNTLPFADKSFDNITICSVLFHMKKADINNMLNDALRLLPEHGKIIVLTPTGQGNMLNLTKYFFAIKNRSIYIWYRATKKRARLWTNENYLAEFALKQKLNYRKEIVMNGFAQLEIINR
jgi:ubiquinone/menaquinone biosynthesis C-methylase UbiE